MNLEQLKNEHPELYQQIRNEGYDEGVKNENARLKEIDEISATVDSALVAKAKYDEPMTAQALAFAALKQDMAAGQTFNNSRVQELNPANNVPAAPQANQNADDEGAILDKIAASANQKRNREGGR